MPVYIKCKNKVGPKPNAYINFLYLIIPKKLTKYFILNKLSIIGPSRRDDLISILYLLLYLREGSLPWTKNFRLSTLEKNFEKVLQLKILFHK